MSRTRTASPSTAGVRILMGAGLVALVGWRPDWVRAAASWYFAQVQALSAHLLGSQVVKGMLVWYFAECQALAAPIIKSMIHR